MGCRDYRTQIRQETSQDSSEEKPESKPKQAEDYSAHQNTQNREVKPRAQRQIEGMRTVQAERSSGLEQESRETSKAESRIYGSVSG